MSGLALIKFLGWPDDLRPRAIRSGEQAPMTSTTIQQGVGGGNSRIIVKSC